MNVQPTNDKVDNIFEQYNAPGSPGCALAVIKDGKIVYQQGYGLANLECNRPILPSTVFNIGSMSKQFTAFAIALLEEEGKLSFDYDLRQYLPEMHDFGRKITIRHLIHHTSGVRCSFPELLGLAEWRDTDATTTEDVYRLLKAQRDLNFRPGDEFLYSNSNYLLLALICERLSEQPFATFCQERIFGPLGMTRSVINDSFFKMIPGRAQSYYDEDDQGTWMNVPLVDSVVGPTNVYTTVEDLAKWDENFYSAKVGGTKVIQRMHETGRLNDGIKLDYAFGLELRPTHQRRGWPMVEHGGNQGGYSSWMVRFPDLHLSVVVLFNLFLWGAREYVTQVADLFLEDKTNKTKSAEESPPPQQAIVPITLSADQLAYKAGTYYNAARGALREVVCINGQLRYQGLCLTPLSENRFAFEKIADIQAEFIPAADNAPTRMKIKTLSGSYDYERVEPVDPTTDKLAQYTGRYYSSELDIYWMIGAGANHLIGQRRKYVDSKMTPLFADVFSDDWSPLMGYPTTYLVVFERDEHDSVTGLRVSGARVRNLKFIKKKS